MLSATLAAAYLDKNGLVGSTLLQLIMGIGILLAVYAAGSDEVNAARLRP